MGTVLNKGMQNIQKQLEHQYKCIKQTGLDGLFIRPDDIYPIINRLIEEYNSSGENDDHFSISQAGASFLEKAIYKITLGAGPINILLWSQMHGNEPTATASLFDLINYTRSPENKTWFDSWRDKITLHIVPMLNPDGAVLEQRVNAQGVDINRDASALQSPEGKLLLSLAEEIKPQVGFNLHSQSRFYTVGESDNSAIISLLAPAYNEAKETNKSRKEAKQLISIINRAIHQQYPNHVGRYDDTYSYRSFGDLLSAKGISTILIEAGYFKNDKHRQIPRWLTFLSLVESINAIRDNSYSNESLDGYEAIPFNRPDGLVDVLLKNVSMPEKYQVDISINYDDHFKNGTIEAIGDLSTITGFSIKDMSQNQVETLKGFQLNRPLILSTSVYLDVLRDGYGYFLGDASLLKIDTILPVITRSEKVDSDLVSSDQSSNWSKLNQAANFLLSKDGKMTLAVINSEIIEL
ncbi:MAG: hypothetical protein L3J46_00380 [Kangiellaceae bacterium]|nr:hypothetical protein [Kangiellaceae bacterium]